MLQCHSSIAQYLKDIIYDHHAATNVSDVLTALGNDFSQATILNALYDLAENGMIIILIHPTNDHCVSTLLVCKGEAHANYLMAYDFREHRPCQLADLKNGITTYLNAIEVDGAGVEAQELPSWQSLLDEIDFSGHALCMEHIQQLDLEERQKFFNFLLENIERWNFHALRSWDDNLMTMVIGHGFVDPDYIEIPRSQVAKMLRMRLNEGVVTQQTQTFEPYNPVEENITTVANNLQSQLSHACTEMWELLVKLAPVMNGEIQPPNYDTTFSGSPLRYDLSICVGRVEAMRDMIKQMDEKLDM